MGSDDSEQDAAANDAARSKILSKEEVFDSEDEPSPDNFIQKKMVARKSRHMPDHSLDDNEPEAEYEYGDIEAAAEDEDGSDYGVHQFIAKDEARDPMGSDDNEADAAANDAARSKILFETETFDSEDTPSPDNFLQKRSKRHQKHMPDHSLDDNEPEAEYEYGDIEAAAEDEDGSDYGVHQFIAKDEARDPMGSDDNEADA